MIPQFVPYDLYNRSNERIRMTNSNTNLSSSGFTAIASAPKPTTVDDYMLFDGTKTIRYSHQDLLQTVAPYSVEMDVFMEAGSGKVIATNGDGFGGGWGEWLILQEATNVTLQCSYDNNGYQFNQTLISNYMTKRWYRIGFMFYVLTGQLRCRGYVNGTTAFDVTATQPYNTSNGMSFGADWTYTSTSSLNGSKIRCFNGRLRNITVFPLIETIEEPPVVGTNPPTWTTQTGNLGAFAEDTDISIPITAEDPDNNIVKYEVIAGALPGGAVLNMTTGVISGRLAEVTEDTIYSFTVKVTDSTDLSITGNFSISVANTKTTVVWQTDNSQTLAEPAPGEPVNITMQAKSV